MNKFDKYLIGYFSVIIIGYIIMLFMYGWSETILLGQTLFAIGIVASIVNEFWKRRH